MIWCRTAWRMYKCIAIGIDQSYKNTGISIVADGQIKDIKSIRLDKCSCNSERREVLRTKLGHLMSVVAEKSDNIVCIVERVRIHGGKEEMGGKVVNFISVDVIKAMGALISVVVDVMYRYGVKVYSVDTRSWKSQVVGTSKPAPNSFGVPNEKWPTIKWVIAQGFEDKILIDVTGTRKQKGVFTRNGIRYQYNDDAADSAGIAMYYFVGDRSKLELER